MVQSCNVTTWELWQEIPQVFLKPGQPQTETLSRRTKGPFLCYTNQTTYVLPTFHKQQGLPTPTPGTRTLPVFRLGLCSPVLESLSSTSMLLLLSLSDRKSLCWDKESLSEWLADGVSDLWLVGDDDLEGDSKNFLIAGWLKAIGSNVFNP